MSATTDLAINYAKMGITNKQEEYKKKKYSSSPNMYGKDDRRGQDLKKGDKDRKYSQDSKRSYSYNGRENRGSRQTSKDKGYQRSSRQRTD